jgi:inosine-uridine nucleoside N-ribohydrolase
LQSGPDKYSKLNGKELVQKKVKELISMAGRFPAGKEFNVEKDAAASRVVFSQWPTRILLSGFEIGQKIKVGLPLINNSKIKNNPVKDVFRISIPMAKEDSAGRMSWDQTAVLIAGKGYKPWWNIQTGKIIIAENGSNTWEQGASLHSYLIESQSPIIIRDLINRLMLHQPMKR